MATHVGRLMPASPPRSAPGTATNPSLMVPYRRRHRWLSFQPPLLLSHPSRRNPRGPASEANIVTGFGSANAPTAGTLWACGSTRQRAARCSGCFSMPSPISTLPQIRGFAVWRASRVSPCMRRTDKSLSITAWLSRDHSHRESIHLASVSASGWWFELSPLGREGSVTCPFAFRDCGGVAEKGGCCGPCAIEAFGEVLELVGPQVPVAVKGHYGRLVSERARDRLDADTLANVSRPWFGLVPIQLVSRQAVMPSLPTPSSALETLGSGRMLPGKPPGLLRRWPHPPRSSRHRAGPLRGWRR
jgi:hypothetical protein